VVLVPVNAQPGEHTIQLRGFATTVAVVRREEERGLVMSWWVAYSSFSRLVDGPQAARTRRLVLLR